MSPDITVVAPGEISEDWCQVCGEVHQGFDFSERYDDFGAPIEQDKDSILENDPEFQAWLDSRRYQDDLDAMADFYDDMDVYNE